SDCRAATAERLGGEVPDTVRQHFDRTAPDGAGVRCAHITSTLDTPGTPRRGLARLALLRLGDGPVPLVVVNDVDGVPGTLRAVELAATLPPAMLETFSLIGMDRRGTGESGSVDCVPPETRATLLDHDPTTTVDPLLDAARVAGQQCAISLEDSRTALDSWRTAGDLDELREQLGVPRLNLLARGEGSTSVAHYTARYPDRVGRVVLDGVPDPSSELVTVLDGVAGSAEATLDEFAADCARRDCPLGDDARTAVEDLIDRARATPLRSGDDRTLGPTLVARAVLTGLA
ncbi:alpha/beta fold hydrolase, partial [Saccharomonospora iraqiensis]|uniref:alpha/beta fold hydrolase n=1 Tax=Saccharomonospora iraqiensis TaxID=52698 RepID=UPI00022DF93D